MPKISSNEFNRILQQGLQWSQRHGYAAGTDGSRPGGDAAPYQASSTRPGGTISDLT